MIQETSMKDSSGTTRNMGMESTPMQTVLSTKDYGRIIEKLAREG